ncbi:S-adenosyl-L-methionine-dependent methyltransferase [Cadophora sp. MPI-SDFR-AT-0126]|nr:S-adenosyl-L-methionine-dependent methyltransferase [Leotiomycetes sp. MPI-SDFR-AT-0126]
MTHSPSEQRSPDEGPSQGVAQNVEEAETVAQQAETTIEASEDEGTDDGYESDRASAASTSLSPSVRNYAFENGRRYHKFREGQYQFPNDEPEQAREDMKHAMVVNLCGGKLHYAPLENPQEILDLGTGTGIWAIDIGDEYPSATVLGVDLSPIQPVWVPPNVRFMVDDFESPWLHGRDRFDFIHARHTSVAVKNMPKLVQQAYEGMKPGGWIEIQEMHHKAHCDDSTMPEGYLVQQWLKNVADGLAVLGPDLLGAVKNAQYLRDAGFVNIEERIFKIPIGTWPKNKTLKMVGLYGRTMIYDGLEGNSLGPFTRGLGWTPDEVQVFLVDVRKALMDSSVHSYLPFHVIFGQKPII